VEGDVDERDEDEHEAKRGVFEDEDAHQEHESEEQRPCLESDRLLPHRTARVDLRPPFDIAKG
jgi:hypothetical protein